MTKFWRVAWQEYSRHVFRKRFLFALLSVPFFLLMIAGLIFLIILMENDATPLGYVDHSGLLANPVPPPPVSAPDKPVPLQPFPSEDEAEAALQAGELQGYYVLPEDYLQTGQAQLVYIEQPKSPAREQFYAFLRVNLLAGYSAQVAERVTQGSEVIVRSPDGSREASPEQFFNIILPFFSGIIFLMAVTTTSGYLMQAVVEEKENRTMEILVTSVSPGQLMAGKVLADIAIGLTQLLAWFAFALLALAVGGTQIPELQNVSISAELLATSLSVLLPAFFMICALMAAIGATVAEASEAQQMSGLLSLPMWLPYMLIAQIMENPNSPLTIGLSLFPITAPLTIMMRAGFTIVPVWQIVLSSAILIASAVGAMWLAGRAFRLGMLRYGQRIRWKEIFSRQKV